MKKTLLILILLTSTLWSYSQTFIREFGKITKSDIELTEVDFDQSADAVVIYDKAESKFVNSRSGFDVVFERSTRIKIFNEAGLDYAQFEIPLFQQGYIYEVIYDLKATTYNFENGLLVKTELNLENTYEVIYNGSWKVKKFAMPDVRPGSIIELSYIVSSQYKFNLRNWDFQRSIPTLYSEYTTRMVPFYEYTFILQGRDKFDIFTSDLDLSSNRGLGTTNFKDMVHRFVMFDVPAFKDEEFITTPNDFLIKVDFQLSGVISNGGFMDEIHTTWPSIIESFVKSKYFGGYAVKSKKKAKKILNLPELMLLSEQEKFDTIVNYVKSNYTWNKSTGKYIGAELDDFLKNKEGNVSNINLFLTGLLNAVGLEAYPVVISTRDNGKIKYEYPFSSFLNYVIVAVRVDDKLILTDATEVMAPNDMIPPRCLNGKGLIVNSEKTDWVDLISKYPARQKTSIAIDFSENLEEMKVNMDITAKEYYALKMRKRFSGELEELKEVISENSNYTVEEIISIDNLNNPDEIFHVNYKVSLENTILNGKMYISPFLSETISDNPLKQTSRKFPIDMSYPKIDDFNTIVYIPKGYKVEYMPESIKINNDLFELSYNANISGETVQIFFSYFFKKGVYEAKDYLKIKMWFDEIVNKSNDKIVLIKDS